MGYRCKQRVTLIEGMNIELYVKACNISELGNSDLSRLEIDGNPIMITRVGDKIYTTDVWCTHEQADLSLGIIRGCTVMCPLHQAQFDITDGRVIRGPNGGDPGSIPPLKTYKNKLQADELWIDI